MQPADVFVAFDTAGGDQRDPALDACGLEKSQCFGNDHVEIEAPVLQVGQLGGAQVATRQAGMLDHDGIGKAPLLLIFADDQLHAPGVGKDGDECDVGMLACQIGQVQRQTRAHDQRVRATGQSVPYIRFVLADGAHDIHGDQAAASESPAPAATRAGALRGWRR